MGCFMCGQDETYAFITDYENSPRYLCCICDDKLRGIAQAIKEKFDKMVDFTIGVQSTRCVYITNGVRFTRCIYIKVFANTCTGPIKLVRTILDTELVNMPAGTLKRDVIYYIQSIIDRQCEANRKTKIIL